MKVKTRYFIVASVSAVILTFFSLISTISFPAFTRSELQLLDWRFNWRGSTDLSDSPIIILGIDDQAYNGIGQVWPYKRDVYAHLISNLNKAGAAVIGLDVVLDIPRRDDPQGDQALRDTLAKYDNVVLIGKYEQAKNTTNLEQPVVPYSEFTQSGTAWGMGSMLIDADGIYRRYMPRQGDFPSFAMVIASEYLGLSTDEFIDTGTSLVNEDVQILYMHPEGGEKVILTDYAGPAYTFTYYSIADVIDDATFDMAAGEDLDYFEELLAEELFADKIVLIGATLDELHDNFPTPFLSKGRIDTESGEMRYAETVTPGVEIHANALQNILNNRYYQRFSGIYQVWMLIALSLLIFLITWYGRIWYAAPFFILLTIGYVGLAVWLFTANYQWLEIIPGVMAFALVFASTQSIAYALSVREKREIRGAFAHYVPKDVVDDLIANPNKLSLGGEERYMSVLFSDVAGFTSISEKLSPKELVGLLNEYLTAMTDIIIEERGIIDKYEGDAIMAEFGAPLYYPDHARRACNAALRMQAKLAQMRKTWEAEKRPALQARVGINSGNMIVGNMGSREVFDYTVMGDAVNLASRLEGANKAYGTYVMISEFTYEWVKEDFLIRPLDKLTVKGKTKPVQVYELMAANGSDYPEVWNDLAARFRLGFDAYLKRDWSKAAKHFSGCLDLVDNDPPSKLYLQRCQVYAQEPPEKDWDGAFVMTSK
jgi:adenylate cyclase